MTLRAVFAMDDVFSYDKGIPLLHRSDSNARSTEPAPSRTVFRMPDKWTDGRHHVPTGSKN